MILKSFFNIFMFVLLLFLVFIIAFIVGFVVVVVFTLLDLYAGLFKWLLSDFGFLHPISSYFFFFYLEKPFLYFFLNGFSISVPF